ncbi:uncharacterized protein LOC120254339 [Dioscorea cayenensis subsp. rotundata]|uniref:Uncharacterized protein LOC120254339 n=1 Tax=Dioscorea cayennensis subsp. rotundata TaxID=55577 RepID=A0AB40AUW3_DIOCR|nr:uncharacterized protein LOC120254339 [Dioscorea cayenensis subsp. rotundata]
MFPGKPEINPNEQCNAMTLRSGTQLEDQKIMKDINQVIETKITDKAKPPCAEIEDKEKEEYKYIASKPYMPPISFPQRLAKAKMDKQFGRFLEILKKLYINIQFTEALQQMPSYAKFLKDILSKKRKLEEYKTVSLTEECSALIQNKLPPKLKDPGSLSIPCVIGTTSFERALCDLGSSVSLMPLFVCRKLEMGELKQITITLQLADGFVKYPIGILEDVPIKVSKFVILADFVVLEMEEDSQIPIILGRPFLATAGAIIDVKHGKLSLTIGDEKVEFDLSNTLKKSFVENSCCRIDSLHQTERQEMPKHCFSNDIGEHEKSLEVQTYLPSQNANIEKLRKSSMPNISKEVKVS